MDLRPGLLVQDSLQKVVSMMQRLVLRHEDSINLLKLEYSFVAHMKIGMPASVVAMLYVAADGWRKLKANEPEKLDRPMRTSLFVCFFAEFKARLTGFEEKPDDVAKMAQLGWLTPGPPLTGQFLKWDPVAQRSVRRQQQAAADFLGSVGARRYAACECCGDE